MTSMRAGAVTFGDGAGLGVPTRGPWQPRPDIVSKIEQGVAEFTEDAAPAMAPVTVTVMVAVVITMMTVVASPPAVTAVVVVGCAHGLPFAIVARAPSGPVALICADTWAVRHLSRAV